MRRAAVLLLALLPTPVSLAADHPKVGLVLGGGGARGAAHVGVLIGLEGLRVPIDAIAGTSIGSIVGGLYAAGLSTEQLDELFRRSNWDDLFLDTPPRRHLSFRRKQEDQLQLWRLRLSFEHGKVVLPTGLVSGQKLGFLLRSLTIAGAPDGEISALPVPFAAVATDIASGKKRVLDRGDLVKAMRASMAVPGVFAPIEWNDTLLVDGGLSDNLPIEEARALGAEVVIAVDVGFPLLPRSELKSVLDISGQVSTILTQGSSAAQREKLRSDDLLIDPQLGSYPSSDFEHAATLIERGRQAVLARAGEFTRFAVSEAEYETWQANRRGRALMPVRLASVSVQNGAGIDTRVLLKRLHSQAGQPLDLQMLQDDLTRLYELDRFERVEFRLQAGEQGSDLLIDAIPRRTGRSYVKMGLNLTSDLRDTGTFNLLTSYTRTWLNRRGGEWRSLIAVGNEPRVSTEVYQPFDLESHWFVLPRLEYGRALIDVFDDTQRLVQFRVRRAAAELSIGRQFGRWGQWRVGYEWTDLGASARVSLQEIPPLSATRRAWKTEFVLDQIDNVNFPRDGVFSALVVESVRTEFGEEPIQQYPRAEFAELWPITRGENTVLLSLDSGSAFGSELPTFDTFSLGGFYRISGLRPGQLSARWYGIGRAVYYRRIAPLPTPLGTGVYAGSTLEISRSDSDSIDRYADRWVYSGSLFIGAETVIGPLYLAVGQTDRGETAGYLYLGRSF
ncbi:MAG: patatin-like phospholipase family protein [Acidobacteriota bacterium]